MSQKGKEYLNRLDAKMKIEKAKRLIEDLYKKRGIATKRLK
jgi:hypothetical protein